MSDFTDDEDRQLVQLALMFSRNRRQILWDRLTQQMKGTKKSKEALRQRLKTLKRTHGRNLENFSAWFFKKKFATKANFHRLCHGIANSKTIPEENKKVLTRGSHYKPHKYAGSKTTVGLELNWTPSITSLTELEETSSIPQVSPCFPKYGKTEPQAAAPASLLLLAYVATRNQPCKFASLRKPVVVAASNRDLSTSIFWSSCGSSSSCLPKLRYIYFKQNGKLNAASHNT